MTEKAAQGLIVPDVCNDIGYAACYLTNTTVRLSAMQKNASKESKDSNPKKKRHTK